MFEGSNFTTRCFIQVADKNRMSIGNIHVLFIYASDCNSTTSQPIPLVSGPGVTSSYGDQYDDSGDRWVVAELTIVNTTANDSGCYYCIAATFDHTAADNTSSTIVVLKSMHTF